MPGGRGSYSRPGIQPGRSVITIADEGIIVRTKLQLTGGYMPIEGALLHNRQSPPHGMSCLINLIRAHLGAWPLIVVV